MLSPCITLSALLWRRALQRQCSAANEHGVVRAVLFWTNPYCSHCHKVRTEDSAAVATKYGDKLEITLIDVSDKAVYERMQ